MHKLMLNDCESEKAVECEDKVVKKIKWNVSTLRFRNCMCMMSLTVWQNCHTIAIFSFVNECCKFSFDYGNRWMLATSMVLLHCVTLVAMAVWCVWRWCWPTELMLILSWAFTRLHFTKLCWEVKLLNFSFMSCVCFADYLIRGPWRVTGFIIQVFFSWVFSTNVTFYQMQK